MSSGSSKTLLAAQVIDADTTTLGEKVDFQSLASEIILVSTVSARTDGTFTTTLEESPDGVTWFVVDSTAAQNANGMVIKKISVSTFHFLRASVLSAATNDGATVKVQLYYRPMKP